MADNCTDSRFKTIRRAKEDLMRATNIESCPAEMAVIDDFLFRAWQMGWLKQYERESEDDVMNAILKV